MPLRSSPGYAHRLAMRILTPSKQFLFLGLESGGVDESSDLPRSKSFNAGDNNGLLRLRIYPLLRFKCATCGKHRGA